MRVLEIRLRRLEDQLGDADAKPRKSFRVVLRHQIREQRPEQARCRRTLWPDGTVFENVVLGTRSDGRELTNEVLDEWVASFPIEEEHGIRPMPLPPP